MTCQGGGSRLELTRPGPAGSWILAGSDGTLFTGPDALDDSAMQSAEQFADDAIAAILAAWDSVGASASDRRS
jgi:hypothetical protein